MTDISRIRTLAGLSTTDQVVAALEASKKELVESHDAAIRQAKVGNRIDEGFFNSLVAALSTAGQASLMGTKAIVDKAKKLAAPIRELYLDSKAKAELKDLLAHTEDVAKGFEDLEKDCPTLMKRDKEIATSLSAFKATMQNFIAQLTTRGSLAQANESQVVLDETNVSKLFEEFLGEDFNAPLNKVKWIDAHMAKIDFQKNRDAIAHALASRLSAADLRKLKDQIENPVPHSPSTKK